MSITLVSLRVHHCYSQRHVWSLLKEAPMLPVESDLCDISQWNWSKLGLRCESGTSPALIVLWATFQSVSVLWVPASLVFVFIWYFFKKGQWNTKGIFPNKMKGCVQSNYMEPSTQRAALFIYRLAEGFSLKRCKCITFSLKKTAECLEKKNYGDISNNVEKKLCFQPIFEQQPSLSDRGLLPT